MNPDPLHLTITNATNRNLANYPVTHGVPLPAGALRTTAGLAIRLGLPVNGCHFLAETNLSSKPNDLGAHGLHHLYQLEGADMGFADHQDFLGRGELVSVSWGSNVDRDTLLLVYEDPQILGSWFLVLQDHSS